MAGNPRNFIRIIRWAVSAAGSPTGLLADGVPLGLVSAGGQLARFTVARTHLDAAVTQVQTLSGQVSAHLDAAYDNQPSPQILTELGFDAESSRTGVPASIQVGKRWVVERTNS